MCIANFSNLSFNSLFSFICAYYCDIEDDVFFGGSGELSERACGAGLVGHCGPETTVSGRQ